MRTRQLQSALQKVLVKEVKRLYKNRKDVEVLSGWGGVLLFKEYKNGTADSITVSLLVRR